MHDVYYLLPLLPLNIPEMEQARLIFRGDPRYPYPNRSLMTDDLINAGELRPMVKEGFQSRKFPNPEKTLQELLLRVEKKTLVAQLLVKKVISAANSKVGNTKQTFLNQFQK